MRKSHPYFIESKIEDATLILTHYFKQAMPDMSDESRQDLHAEMRDVVEAIVDAAIMSTPELSK